MKKQFPWLFSQVGFFNSTYVLDTNVLLNLYRVHDKSRTELLAALTAAKPYLWSPHHIVREFLTSRPGVIAEYRGHHDDVCNKISSVIDKALISFDDTPYIKNISEIIRGSMSSVYSAVRTYGEQYGCTLSNGNVLRELIEIFEGKIGAPYDSKSLEDIVKEAKRRVASGLPPGLCDADQKSKKITNKDDIQSLIINNVYGDIIIWKQIIDYSVDNKVPHITFVTDDRKKGDWTRFHDERYNIGPRVELCEELYNSSGCLFNVLSTKKFFELCQENFRLSLADAVVEIDDVDQARAKIIRNIIGSVAKQTNWMQRDLYKFLSQTYSIREHNQISTQSPDEIRMLVESRLLPYVLVAKPLKHRLGMLVNAIVNENHLDQHDATVMSQEILRRSIFNYYVSGVLRHDF